MTTLERAREVQDHFRSIEASVLNRALTESWDEVGKDLSERFGLRDIQPIDFATIAQIAQKAELEDFHNFLNTGEVPPIRLAPEQMERLKGGGFLLAVVGAILVYDALDYTYRAAKNVVAGWGDAHG